MPRTIQYNNRGAIMLKKNIKRCTLLLLLTASYLHANIDPVQISQKTIQLHDLQKVAEKINRLKPLGNYLVTVPSFLTLTTSDVEQFLAGIPANVKDSRGKTHTISMLQHIKTLWQHVVDEIHSHKEITPAARESLIEIRKALQIAFRHDLRNGRINNNIKSFIDRNVQQRNALIVRSATLQPLFSAKSVYPISAQDIHYGIAQVLSSYFSEDTINQMMAQGSIDAAWHLEAILQSMIMEDKKTRNFVVSGIACSYDKHSNIPNIVTIESTFGHGTGLKDQHLAADAYYIHDGITYPIIAKKLNRYVPDFDMKRSRLQQNPQALINAPTLDVTATLEVARAAQLLEELYDASVCISFVKRGNTIYLVKIQTPDAHPPQKPTYFDPTYLKKLPDERQISIKPIQPTHELAIIKKRDKVILAPDLRTFLTLLGKRENPKEVTAGIIKELPTQWSKEQDILSQTNIPVFWTSEFDTLRSWVDQKRWPLIFDPQQQTAFTFKRCRGFCTLYQAIEKGIYTHPLPRTLSTLPDFLPALTQAEKAQLKPEEFFSGVKLDHLFNLLKTGSYQTAQQALKTLLYRLHNAIILEQITQKECELNEETFDNTSLLKKQELLRYTERIAFQLLQQLKRWSRSNKTTSDDLEKNFLINLLDTLIAKNS